MRKFKAVIFDLDDTLYSEIDYVISGFAYVAEFLSPIVKMDKGNVLDFFTSLFEEDKKDVFDRFLFLHGIKDDEILKKSIDIYRSHLPKITLSPDVVDFLKWLKNNGFKVGIITDGRPEAQWNKIRALGLEQYCNNIIVTDELGGLEFRKPSMVPYKKILALLQVKPEESIYIGDNPAKDFISPNKLGMTSVMLKRNDGIYSQDEVSLENDACYVVEQIIDIKEILELIF